MIQKHNSLDVILKQSTPIPLDVSLRCNGGELLALTGPSGSGKTTVLRAIAGLQDVSAGKVVSNGVDWLNSERGVNLSAQQRRTGFVFQQYALFPHLDVLQNVIAAMGHLRNRKRKIQALEIIAKTNMSGLEKRLPSQLSGGQKQRVALARALAREPSVLLLDEPFSAVDQQTRHRLYKELSQLREELSLPMILVTHDMSEVMQLADTISLIHHGKSLQSGPLQEVVQQPNSVAAAKLLGHKNLFEATVLETSDGATTIEVLGSRLKCAASGFTLGQKVTALIPASSVILHRRDRPSRGERENPVTGKVIESTTLGDELLLKLDCGQPREPLTFSLSKHVAARNGVMLGVKITVSVLNEAICLIAG